MAWSQSLRHSASFQAGTTRLLLLDQASVRPAPFAEVEGMGYATFLAGADSWVLYPGIGVTQAPIVERKAPFRAVDFSIGTGWIWVCGERSVCRVDLPTLDTEHISFAGRAGAIGSAPDRARVAVVALPDSPNEKPQLLWWDKNNWQKVNAELDISSKVAWIDENLIAFESVDRRLCVVDTANDSVRSGPPGFYPAAAHVNRSWFAVVQERLVRFPVTGAFDSPPVPVPDFDCRNPVQVWLTADGQVCTWKQPKALYRTSGYYQMKGSPPQRFPEIDESLGAIVAQENDRY